MKQLYYFINETITLFYKYNNYIILQIQQLYYCYTILSSLIFHATLI